VSKLTTRIKLEIISKPDVDFEELERLTVQLREELLDLDLESVELVKAGETPEKAKVGEPVTWGALLLTLASSGGVLTMLLKVLQSWLARTHQPSVHIEIDGDQLEIKGISSEDQKRLIEDWLQRHSKI